MKNFILLIWTCFTQVYCISIQTLWWYADSAPSFILNHFHVFLFECLLAWFVVAILFKTQLSLPLQFDLELIIWLNVKPFTNWKCIHIFIKTNKYCQNKHKKDKYVISRLIIIIIIEFEHYCGPFFTKTTAEILYDQRLGCGNKTIFSMSVPWIMII